MSDSVDIDALASHRTIDLTTIGRGSGLPRRIEIWWFQVGDRFFITGTPGARDWYANVLADPGVVIHVAGMDLPARALPVRDPELRALVFDDPPMVEVEFEL
jgi:deazaflavin-dependent oxidoreductase (nitroreductase family)